MINFEQLLEYGVVFSYRLSENEEFKYVDSCYGFIGDSWNCPFYLDQFMKVTVDCYNSDSSGDACSQ